MLRDLWEAIGAALLLATILGGLQLLEWGLAAEPAEPPEVDSVEIPNPVDARVQGAGLRSQRARALAAERRLSRLREAELEDEQ